jgi:fimbrial chaperone protein
MRLFTGGGWRAAFAWTCLGLAICRAEAVSASALRVSPVQVTLSAASPTTLLSIGNDSDKPIRVQVSASAWDQDASGKMLLTATQDVIFFPMMLKLAPHEERRVRVGTTASPGSVEKTYRLFVEELPAAATPTASGGFQIQVLTRVGIPVFVQPAEPKPETVVEFRGVSDQHLHYAIRNVGNAHVMVQSVHLRGSGENGGAVFESKAEGWYILAGGEREYMQPLDEGGCAGLKSVALDAATDRGALSAKLDVSQPFCEPVTASTASLRPE